MSENLPQPSSDRSLIAWRADRQREAKNLAEFRQQFIGEKREAASLIDQTFTIVEARQYPSTYEGQSEEPFFVIAYDENGVKFHTTLGGKAVVEDLMAWAKYGDGSPLTVTLRFHEGRGQYKGYYTFD